MSVLIQGLRRASRRGRLGRIEKRVDEAGAEADGGHAMVRFPFLRFCGTDPFPFPFDDENQLIQTDWQQMN